MHRLRLLCIFGWTLILIGSASAQRERSAPAERSPGVLMGTVTTPSGTPVGTALVSAMPIEAQGQHSARPFETRIGRDGTFQMLLPFGRYLVGIRAPGFRPVFFKNATNRGEALPVVLTADAPEVVWPVVLAPIATLSGRVVAVETEQPVSGGFVIAEHKTGRFQARAPIVEGAFLLEGLPEGAYGLTADVNGYVTGTYDGEIRVEMGDVLTDLTLSVSEGLVCSGVVRDVQGRVLAGARVVALPVEGNGRRQWAVASEDGAYRLSGLEAGPHRFGVRLPGYELMGASDSKEAFLSVEVDRAVEALDFVLNPIGAIFGAVRNREGKPLGGARVVAEPIEGGKRVSARTDASGAYVLAGLAPGDYVVWANAEGYVSSYYDGVDRAQATPILVESDAHTTDVDFSMVEGGEITGFVLAEERGRFLSGAIVTAHRRDQAGRWQAISDGSGRFVLSGLPDGAYVLRAEARGYVGEFLGDARAPDASETIAVGAQKVYDAVRFELARRQPADLDANGVIDFADLLVLIKRMTGRGRGQVPCDLTGDGEIDFRDFLAFAQAMQRAGKMASGAGALSVRQVADRPEELVAEVLCERLPASRGYALRLRYDPGQAEFLGAEAQANGLFGNRHVWTHEANGAILLFVFDADAGAAQGTGALVQLRFRPRDGTTEMVLQTDLGLSLDDGGILVPLATPVPLRLEALPDAFRLMQNVPNPFNPETMIAFELPQMADVELAVYNLVGQRVRTLVRERRSAGRYQVAWDGRDDLGRGVSSGVYFYRFRANDFWSTRRMLLVR